MRGNARSVKCLSIALKIGKVKKYEWDKVDFTCSKEDRMLIVRDIKSGELSLAVPIDNVLYYERTEEIIHGN
jgi:hypothetical protein